VTILYLDCASGVSGDMLLGALLDLGVELRLLRSRLAVLPVKGYSITSRRVTRAGFAARKVDVRVTGRHAHRGLKEIRGIVEKSRLDPAIKSVSMTIFRRIIREEARIHGIPEQRVHLHEVGAVDAILDIVGAVAGVAELLGPPGEKGSGRIACSALNVGHGTVSMQHGRLPVPAPATAALLAGKPIYAAGPHAELVTPTGAAIVTTLAESFGPPPPMVIEKIGYGAGDADFEGHPNVLRAMLGSSWEGDGPAGREVMVLECTIDDMNPQGYGYLMERLLDAGAMEVFYTAVQMKKDRPGVLVTVICAVPDLQPLARIVFEETTTLGIRHRVMGRLELERRTDTVTTPYGKIRLKIASLEGRVSRAQPEYEDCRRAAARRRVPLDRVRRAALAAWERLAGEGKKDR